MNKAKIPAKRPPFEDLEPHESDDAIIGVALRWSLLAILVAAGIVTGGYFWLMPEPSEPETSEAKVTVARTRQMPDLPVPSMPFVDITESAGIDFEHENGAYGDKLLPETMGGGCAFLDYDGDGDQDLLLVNSARWPWDPRGQADSPATMRLFQNDGTGRFQDVTRDAGLAVSFYGMGVAVGDYDNDGDADLFFTAVGPNRLFRNEGGRFVDVTQAAGVAGAPNDWGTSCGWFDYNNDGRLDLFVCNYVDWSREIDLGQNFQLTGVGRAYGPPTAFQGSFPYLYRNDGGGRFTDVSAEAGIQIRNLDTQVPMAKSMGLAAADLDQDGWIDLVVANDTVQNFLFHNQGDGTFQEIGALAGIAYDAQGRARGAMGIDTAHHRNDATLSVAIGNFSNEMTAFYCAHENPFQFVDTAIANGLGPATLLELTFGLFFFDVDLDGRLDLLAANGHLEDEINKVLSSQHYEQPPQLFWNCGPDSRTEYRAVAPRQIGPDFHRPMVGRGAAYADIDGDGDTDVLLTAVGGRPRLLRNDQRLEQHWLRFRLTGTRCNRDAIGSWIEVHIGERRLRRQVMATRSYLSQCELPVTIGIGAAEQVDKVEIQWADGTRQLVPEPVLDGVTEVVQAGDAA